MLVDHVVASIDSSAGGTTTLILNLMSNLSEQDELKVRLITASYDDSSIGSISRKVEIYRNSVKRLSAYPIINRIQRKSNTFPTSVPHLIHSHGLWNRFNRLYANRAHRIGLPLVLQPHGMLEPWALSWKPWRKKIALSLYQRRDIEAATLLVATAEQEADNFRRVGLRMPIAIIPGGVDIKAASSIPKIHTSDVDFRRVLFIGRIHPVKGLMTLLRALSSVYSRGWILQIAGPDECDHLKDVLALAKELGLSERVVYLGVLDEKSKWSVYNSADLFVLPSFTENFGIVIVEALSAGLPVITTRGTPWIDLHAHNCGWWVEPTVEGLTSALGDAISLPQQKLSEMGERGRVYVQRYNWSRVAAQMADVYRWILKRGPISTCIRLD